MKRFLFALATAAMTVTIGVAHAGDWRDGYGPRPYWGGYGPYYYSAPSYGYGPGIDTPSTARIKAAHSRYRYYTHPRSQLNSPPSQAAYFGWQPDR